MKEEKNKVPLGNLGIDYLKSKLEDGMTFAQIILKNVDLKQGDTFTFVPIGDQINSIDDLTYGGKGSYNLSWEKINVCVENFLNSNPSGMIIFEDPTATFGESYIKRFSSEYISFNDEPYFYFFRKSDMDYSQNIGEAIRVWLNLIYFVKDASEFVSSENTKLSPDLMEKLFPEIQYIVVNAFDYDGHVYWQKT